MLRSSLALVVLLLTFTTFGARASSVDLSSLRVVDLVESPDSAYPRTGHFQFVRPRLVSRKAAASGSASPRPFARLGVFDQTWTLHTQATRDSDFFHSSFAFTEQVDGDKIVRRDVRPRACVATGYAALGEADEHAHTPETVVLSTCDDVWQGSVTLDDAKRVLISSLVSSKEHRAKHAAFETLDERVEFETQLMEEMRADMEGRGLKEHPDSLRKVTVDSSAPLIVVYGFAPERPQLPKYHALHNPIPTRQSIHEVSNIVEVLLVSARSITVRWSNHPSSSLSLLEHSTLVMQQVDAYFQRLGLSVRIMFKALEAWLTNEADLNQNSDDDIVDVFKEWGQEENTANAANAHDIGAMLVGSEIGGLGIAASVSRICTTPDEGPNGYGVTQDYNVFSGTRANENWAMTSNIMAHELTHALGVPRHAEDYGCAAGNDYIMEASVNIDHFKWSSCTKTRLSSKFNDQVCLTTLRNSDQEACGHGYYADSSGSSYTRCKPCHSSCYECSGSTASHCTRCSSDKSLFGTQCADSCGEGRYSYFDDGFVPIEASRVGARCRLCSDQPDGLDLTCPEGQFTTCNPDNGGAPIACVEGSPPSLPPPPVSESQSTGGGASGGAIAGGVIAALFVIGLPVGYVMFRRRQGDSFSDIFNAKMGGSGSGSRPKRTSSKDTLSNPNNTRDWRTSSRDQPAQLMHPVLEQPTSYTGPPAEPQPPAPWEKYVDDDGNPYYYNSVTGASQWEFPAA